MMLIKIKSKVKATFEQSLSSPQLLLAVVLFCFSLAAYAGWSFFTRVQTLKIWKEKIVAVETKLPLLESIPTRESDLLLSLRTVDPLYLERRLGGLRLSRLEAYSLESAKQALTEAQAERLHFLMGHENALRFIPGKIVKGATQAVEMKQEHPVEVDEKDVQKILAYIEGSCIGNYAPADNRPPMTIKKFSLKRKKGTEQRFPSYLLDIELWRREAAQNL